MNFCSSPLPALSVTMATLLEPSTALEDKVRELCEFITDSPRFGEARAKIDAFLENDAARETYRAWQEMGHELHRKSHEGYSPTDDELARFESLKNNVMTDPLASAFVEAEDAMNRVFGMVTKMVQKTLQLGRVPTSEDLAESGCCGGGGCGCH